MPYSDKEKGREHHREYMKIWYEQNREKHLRYVAECKRKKQQWFEEIRASLKCSKCDEKHPAVLDFHHQDPSEKESDVTTAVRQNWSKERILSEIAKCVVLCSNCHRKLHWENGEVGKRFKPSVS